MKRGDLVTASAGSGYAGKPRPVLIIQDDALALLDSVVVCPLSATPQPASFLRPALSASPSNGLDTDSVIMTDKVVAVPRHKLREVIGLVDSKTMVRVMRGVATVIGLGQPYGGSTPGR